MRRITRPGRSAPISWWMLLMPAIISVPFLVIGLVELAKTVRMVAASSVATGTVVANEWTAFAEGGAAYVPRVSFETPDGQTVTFSDGTGTVPPEFEVGAQVTVLYNPSDPQSARIDTWQRLWLGPWIITGVGIVPLLIALAVTLLLRRRTKG